MARFLVCWAVVCGLACGSDGKVIVGGGAGGGMEPSGGSTGEPVGEAGTDAGGSGGTGGGGSGGAPVEEPGSDVIDVGGGDFNSGEPPVTGGEALPQIVNLTGPAAVTNGGSAILHVELSSPVASPIFVVSLDGDTGYHTVTGLDPDGDGVHDISVQVAAEANQASLMLRVALADAAGNVGPYREIEIVLVQSGTGDVKITLSWDRLHDLDLHVIEPSGAEVQFTAPASATGGTLDLDSGINCMPSQANTENIFWPPQGAPPGQYIVTVHNYQQCTPGALEYSVRVAYDNVVNTYTGTFADGTAGEAVTAGTVKEVVRFQRGQ
jgi:hypothetical protein